MATMTDRIALLIEAKDAGAAKTFTAVGKAAGDAQKKADKLGKSTEGATSKTKGLAAAFGVTGEALKAGLIAGVSSLVSTGLVEFLSESISSTLELANATAQLQGVTNASAQEASKFAQALQTVGVDTNDAVEIFTDFQQAVQQGKVHLDAMGVSLTKNKNGTTNWVTSVESVVSSLQNVEDGTQRAQIAFAAFGEEGGKQILRLVNSGVPLNEMLGKFSGMTQQNVDDSKKFEAAMTGLKGSATELEVTIGTTLIPVLTELATLAQPVASAVSGIGDAFGKAGIGLGTFTALVPGLNQILPKLREHADQTAKNKQALQDYQDALKKAETPQQKFNDLVAQGVTSGPKYAEALRNFAAASGEAAAQSADLQTKQKTLNDLLAQGVTSGPQFAAAIAAVGSAQAQSKSQTDAATTALDIYMRSIKGTTEALYGYLDASLAAAGSQIGVQRAIANVTASVKDNSTALEGNSEKALNNREAIINAIGAIEQHKEAVEKQTGSQVKANAAFEAEATALYNSAIQAGFNKGQVDALFKSLGLLPPTKTTKVETPGLRQAREDTEALARAQREIDQNIFINVFWQQHGVPPSGITGHPTAAGGPRSAGELLLVGERGPELFVPNVSGFVVPNHQLGGVGRTSGTVNINVDISGVSDRQVGAEAGREIVRQIREYERRSGTGWRRR